MPSDNTAQAEQAVFSKMPSAVRQGQFLPKTLDIGYRIELLTNFPGKVKIFADIFLFLGKTNGQPIDQRIKIRRIIEPFPPDTNVLIGIGIHTEKDQFVGNTQTPIQIACGFPLAQKPHIMHAWRKSMSVQVKTMAPAAGHVVLFEHQYLLTGARQADRGRETACPGANDDSIPFFRSILSKGFAIFRMVFLGIHFVLISEWRRYYFIFAMFSRTASQISLLIPQSIAFPKPRKSPSRPKAPSLYSPRW